METELQTLNSIIEEYATKRERRLSLESESRKLASQEESLHEKIVIMLRNRGMESAGAHHTVEIEKKEVPKCEDWNKFYEWMVKNKAYDCLHKRLTDLAIKARWDEKTEIPGVVKFPVFKLKLGKV